MEAVVVGAGIGGLTAANALSQQGWTVRVIERAEALENVGAGLAVAPNALRVLDLIGAGESVRALAALQGDGGIRGHDGRWLARTSVETVSRRLGVPFVIARRSDLVGILHDRLPAGTLTLGRDVRSLTPGGAGERATVVTDDETIEADLVVCADGIRSLGRHALFPDAPGPAYSGCANWRLVVPRTGDVRPGETWGPGRAFGLMPLTRDEVYCYAMAYAPPGVHAADGELTLLRELFGGWHDPIPALLTAADPADVLRNDVYDLPTPLTPFHSGRVALLGDAAHAMTPNLGQGACQAIEDAAVLAYRVGAGDGVVDALAAYTRDRRPRTTSIVQRSRRMMRMAQLSAPAAVGVRNLGMAAARLLTADMTARIFLGVAGWRPPQEQVAVTA